MRPLASDFEFLRETTARAGGHGSHVAVKH